MPCKFYIYAPQGLAGNSLWEGTRAIVISRLVHASPAWWGFIGVDGSNRLQSVLNKLKIYGFLPHDFDSFSEFEWN